MTLTRSLLILLCCVAALTSATAQPMRSGLVDHSRPTPAPTPTPLPARQAPPEVRKLLDRIEERHSDLKSLRADVEEHTVSQVFLGDETIARGRLAIDLPDRLRFDYLEPDRSTVLFNNDVYYEYARELHQVDRYTYDSPEQARKYFRLILLGFGVSTEQVLENYNVSLGEGDGEDGRELVFEPRDLEIARTLESIRVRIDPDTLLPEKVWVQEVPTSPDIPGDRRTLTITSVETDVEFEGDWFRLDLPADTDIIEH